MADTGLGQPVSGPAAKRLMMGRPEEAVASQLGQTGFPHVVGKTSIRVRPDKTRMVDLVAWAGDEDGELRPYAAIEVKARADVAAMESALFQLSFVRDDLGTRAHYVVAEGKWYKADAGLREVHCLPGPPLAAPFDARRVSDVDVVMSLLSAEMWAAADAYRGSSGRGRIEGQMLRALLESLAKDDGAGPSVPIGDQRLAVSPEILWQAVQRFTRGLLGRSDVVRLENTSRSDLAPVMANLLGPTLSGDVYDPFMGVGSTLWAAGDRVANGTDRGITHVRLRGAEINSGVAELARGLGALSPHAIEVNVRNSFIEPVRAIADYVISEPPAELRLDQPYRVDRFVDVRDADLAVIDVALRALRPGGRAVLHLPLPRTSRGGQFERFRAYLLDNADVEALIGLPVGTYAATAIPSILLLSEPTPPPAKPLSPSSARTGTTSSRLAAVRWVISTPGTVEQGECHSRPEGPTDVDPDRAPRAAAHGPLATTATADHTGGNSPSPCGSNRYSRRLSQRRHPPAASIRTAEPSPPPSDVALGRSWSSARTVCAAGTYSYPRPAVPLSSSAKPTPAPSSPAPTWRCGLRRGTLFSCGLCSTPALASCYVAQPPTTHT